MISELIDIGNWVAEWVSECVICHGKKNRNDKKK